MINKKFNFKIKVLIARIKKKKKMISVACGFVNYSKIIEKIVAQLSIIWIDSPTEFCGNQSGNCFLATIQFHCNQNYFVKKFFNLSQLILSQADFWLRTITIYAQEKNLFDSSLWIASSNVHYCSNNGFISQESTGRFWLNLESLQLWLKAFKMISNFLKAFHI